MAFPAPRRGSSLGHVRGPLTTADRSRLAANNRPQWRPVILDAMAWYQTHPRPDSRVHPQWVPVTWLAEICDQLDIDHLVATLVHLQRDGAITQRTMLIDGINHPVATLNQYRQPPAVLPVSRLPPPPTPRSIAP